VSHDASGGNLLDTSKVPTDLVVHRVWQPDSADKSRGPVAYVSERRRRAVGAALIGLGTALALTSLVLNGTYFLTFLSLLIAWSGTAHAAGGRAGFYEVRGDGSLGDYLGRTRPPN